MSDDAVEPTEAAEEIEVLTAREFLDHRPRPLFPTTDEEPRR